MRDNLKSKTVCFIDNGLFVELAIRVAPEFKKVMYYTPWISGFPSKKGVMPGAGLESIERVNDFWEKLDEIDLFVFPDVYFGSLQGHLRKLGKNVWGGGHGDDLELYRYEAKEFFKSLGLPVQPCKRIYGLDKLREHLKTVENKWIKISVFRGDGETWHHEKYSLSEPMLDKLESTLGAMKYDYEFLVEDSIDGEDIVEAGSDLFSIDGQYPNEVITGFEIKDLGYLGAVKKYSEISPLVTDYNKKIAPYLKEVGYRGFMSTEIRVGNDKKPYMIDACQRAGSPPNELYQEMIGNWAEILWNGAQGIMVQPIYLAKFGIEVMMHSDWASQNWQAIDFPPEIRQWVKLRNACKINGRFYVVPQHDELPEIGAVVAIGETVQECIDKVKGYCDQVEGYRLDLKVGSIDEAIETAKKGERLGIKFF